MSKLKRETRETRIICDVRKGSGVADVKVDDRFLAHMVETLARYASLDVTLEATGDLKHHLVEDVAITLALALKDEIPAKAARYGWAAVPMDEALAEAAVDLGGRPYYVGRTPVGLYTHFLRSFATNVGATLHVRQALAEGDQVFSTKGSVGLERLDP
jgi:imidazoleglycerol-phosphate dehydratase